MAKIKVEGINDFVPPSTLGGDYLVVCKNAQLTENNSILLSEEVIDGAELPDGSSPIGRTYTHFLNLSWNPEWEGHEARVKRMLHYTGKAFGVSFEKDLIDPEEFVGRETRQRIRCTDDVAETYQVTRVAPV